MVDTPDFSTIAALVGDETRGHMLAALMDGRARTATELSLVGGVAPSTASTHLARLTEAALVTMVKQGRHRYFRITSAEVARVVEGLMGLAARNGLSMTRPGPRDDALRRARLCYDHLAGEVAVQLLERLRTQKIIDGADELMLTTRGEAWCDQMGIDLAALRSRRRPICLTCLDWSERKSHLAGALGAAVLDRLLESGSARRGKGARAVVLAPRGVSFVHHPELAL